MRAFAGLLWASAALRTYAVSAQALIYTSEAITSPWKEGPLSISPITARLLLAQRLGLSQYHSLEDADRSTIDVLNIFGGRQLGVFQNEEQTDTEKLLLLIEGVSNPEDIFDQSIRPSLSIDHPPSSLHNEELVSNLLEQDQHSKSGKLHGFLRQSGSSKVHGGISAARMGSKSSRQSNNAIKTEQSRLTDFIELRKEAGSTGHDLTTILHVSTLQGLKPKDGDRYTTALSDIKAFIAHFHNSNTISSTIILTPATSKPAKRTATSPYGTFTKPLSTRQQQAQPEEPLTTPSFPSTNQDQDQNQNQPSLTSPPQSSNSTSPLPHGLLPICHPSLSAAISATKDCSGHGTAYKKGSGDGGKDCYACKCSPTIFHLDGGGTKTIYWGGPACQKKDISVPFFLLAGLSIALVAVVAWGVGLLASIGQEDLPSVIGAGVTGLRAQK